MRTIMALLLGTLITSGVVAQDKQKKAALRALDGIIRKSEGHSFHIRAITTTIIKQRLQGNVLFLSMKDSGYNAMGKEVNRITTYRYQFHWDSLDTRYMKPVGNGETKDSLTCYNDSPLCYSAVFFEKMSVIEQVNDEKNTRIMNLPLYLLKEDKDRYTQALKRIFALFNPGE